MRAISNEIECISELANWNYKTVTFEFVNQNAESMTVLRNGKEHHFSWL